MFPQKISPLLIFAAFVAVATFMLNMTAEARVYANEIGSASDLGIPMVSANQPQLQNIFNILIMIAGALAVVFIMVGGVMYVVSIGSPDRVEKAKNTILYAVIGLVVAVLAGAIMNFVVTSL